MKEIKFRGKHITSGRWVYGWYVELKNVPTIIEFDGDTAHQIDKDTLGQYIGLKNIEEIEIYDGDIIGKFKPSKPEP